MKQKSQTSSQVAALFALAAVILGLIVVVSPAARVTTNAVSGEVYGIDIFGLNKAATDLPEQQFAAY
jgi:hypothetical protein